MMRLLLSEANRNGKANRNGRQTDMTDSHDVARARAEAVFRTVTPEQHSDAMTEHRAQERVEREKMARLRALRLAKENAKK
jgi:hypothetical protein